ncbi:SAF domain-containing protein [Paenarthrobacter sp. JL.01a]|uniref:SAF domain-containing protein n=1 Tax=Paenarthrobacter sp. JL.01a TaxID=2979324 RepID=UPI0021CA89B0|nr:SAF domain-containing protein [Paenarthrobacter sp. JL.01a]UXM90334.1 SAF domain-containing protein [Paenarthrobacter sp. JL.01a]
MGPSASPAAARISKPSWRDPRLLVGILLVFLSVAGVVALVGNADKTTQVYAAREDIAVGQQVTAEDLSIVKVRLDEVEAGYVTVEDGLSAGKVALQRVARNQLLPRESLGTADALNRKPVAISMEEELPAQAVPGARVDVWVAMPGTGTAYDNPQLLLPGAEIAGITHGSTTLGASKTTTVLVLVTDAQMPKLLAAQANKAKVSVVWNPAGLAS